MNDHAHEPNIEPQRSAAPPTGTGRRAFMADVGRKAIYITPIVLTLTARPAVASPHSASCKPPGGSCRINSDCCSNNCDTNVCL